MEASTATHEHPSERRAFKRIHTLLSGRLTSGERVSDGIVLDLSVSGAKIRTEQPSVRGATVTMYIVRLGEFKGEVMWRAHNLMGLRFMENPLQVSDLMDGFMPQECLAH